MVSMDDVYKRFVCGIKQWKRRKKDRKKAKLTMVVIPHCQAQSVKNISIPWWALKLGFLGCLVLGFTLTYYVYGYFSLAYLVAENQTLQQVNARQAGEITELKNMTGDMQNRLEGLMEIDREVRAKVGLSEPREEGETLVALQTSRSANSHYFLALGVGEQQVCCPYCLQTFYWGNKGAVLPYGGQAPNDGSAAEEKTDALEDLRLELAKVDFLLTSRAKSMEKLRFEVENQDTKPSAWPCRGYISSSFGTRKNPFNHEAEEFHTGIDISGSYGNPVRAAGKGVVTFAGSKGNWGNMILVAHGSGYVSQYAHNSSLLVQENETVEKGQIIARMGNTGRCTGTHLHFGIAKNGVWVNPLEKLE